MTTRTRRTSPASLSGLLLGLLLVAAPLARAAPLPSAPAAQDAEAAADRAPELPAVEAPPELRTSDAVKLERELKKLRNSKATARRKTEDKIIRLGRGCLPELLAAATTDHAGKADGLRRCVLELADLRDRELIGAQLESELPLLRRIAAEWIARHAFAPLVEPLRPLVRDADAEVAWAAALALTRLGQPDGLDVILARVTEPTGREVDEEAKSRAAADAELAKAALGALAGNGKHSPLVAGMRRDETLERDDPAAHAATRRASVQLLAAIGDDVALGAVHAALDDPHNLVQRDAIDALRRLLEDKPPFDGGSIFAQLKEVDRLKKLPARRR